MKKTLLILLIGLLGLGNIANAQFKASPYYGSSPPAKATTADNELVWGYSGDDVASGVGVGSSAALSGAVHFTSAQFGVFEGQTITGVNIGLSSSVTNMKVFIRNTLTGADVYSQTVGSAAKGWKRVDFTTPFTIPSGDFYVGYTATGVGQIGFSGDSYEEACYLSTGSGWSNYVGNEWGSLCLKVIIDVTGYNKKDMGFAKLYNTYAKVNESFEVTGYVRNNSISSIGSFTLEYKINNGTPIQKTATCFAGAGALGSFSFTADALDTAGAYTLSMTILQVGGEDDQYAGNNTKSIPLEIFKYLFPKKVVVEEGTGTWCQYCPRGIVGLERMKERYPDNFIGIAIHSGDEMALSNTSYISGLNIPEFPGSRMNRKGIGSADPIDPSYESLDEAYREEMTIPCQVGIELDAYINTENNNEVEIVSTVTFGYNSSSINYKIAYVLVENDVTGYTQTNAYAGGGIGEMGGWENLPLYASVPLNEVARGIYSAFGGITGSIPTTVEENKPIGHSYSITLPSSIQDMDQLELVALLIDTSTGHIVNADKVHLEIMGDVAVAGVTLNENEIMIGPGQTFQLTASISPKLADNHTVSWSSSDSEIATVSANGLVTAVTYGEATITVTTEDGGFTDECVITVYPPVESVSLNKETLDLALGDTFLFVVTIEPENAGIKDITWSYGVAGILSYLKNNPAMVKGNSEGETTVTVTTEDGGLTASCDVKVYDPVSIDKVVSEETIGHAYVKDGSLFVTVNATGNVVIDLFDISGRKLLTNNASLNGKGVIVLSVDSDGIYLIRVTSTAGTFTKKVIL